MPLTKQQKQLLISGYIRINNSEINRKNINLLNEQCYSFYQEIFEWRIKGETLNHFIHAHYGKSFVSPKIKHHDIHFIYKIYPNGRSRNDQGHIAILFKLLFKPKDIDKIDTLCTVFLENKLIYQTSVIFNSDHKSYQLSTSSMLSEYIHFASLTFSMNVEILNVQYHQQSKDERFDIGKWIDYHSKYFKSITVHQYSKYEWKLNELILREIRNRNNKKYYMEEHLNNDDVWNVSFESSINECLLGLHLIQLPYDVHTMNIRFKLTVKCDNNDQDFISIMDVQNVGLNHVQNINCHYSDHGRWKEIKNSINTLTFIWEIFVLQTVDFYGNILFNDDKQHFRFFNELINC